MDCHVDGGKGDGWVDLVLPAYRQVVREDGVGWFMPGMLELQAGRGPCFVELRNHRVRIALRRLNQWLLYALAAPFYSAIVIIALRVVSEGGFSTPPDGEGIEWLWHPWLRRAVFVAAILFASVLVLVVVRLCHARGQEETPVTLPAELLVPVRKWLKDARTPAQKKFEPSMGAQAAGGEGEVIVEMFRMAWHEWRVANENGKRAAGIRSAVAEAILRYHRHLTGYELVSVSEWEFKHGDGFPADAPAH